MTLSPIDSPSTLEPSSAITPTGSWPGTFNSDIFGFSDWGVLKFFKSLPHKAPTVFFSTRATKSVFEQKFKKGSYLIFGSETKGLGKKLLEKFSKNSFQIPQYDDRVRSLNLANAASIVVYEAIRQLGP